jgi:hypothetical protein
MFYQIIKFVQKHTFQNLRKVFNFNKTFWLFCLICSHFQTFLIIVDISKQLRIKQIVCNWEKKEREKQRLEKIKGEREQEEREMYKERACV